MVVYYFGGPLNDYFYWPRKTFKVLKTTFIYIIRYEQVVEEPFHISKACVEPATCKGKVASVYVEANDEEFLVCNLSDKILNETLDLNFNQGDKIVFKSSVIHYFDFYPVVTALETNITLSS